MISGHCTCEQRLVDPRAVGGGGPNGGVAGGSGAVRRPGRTSSSELGPGGGQQVLQSPQQCEPAAAAPGSSQVNTHSSGFLSEHLTLLPGEGVCVFYISPATV